MHSARAESRRSWASKDEFGAETTSSESKAGKLRVGYQDEDERQHEVEKMTIVTEFVPLHDIPYIFLSPDGGPYFSVDEFLSSPDRYPDPSTSIPDISHL